MGGKTGLDYSAVIASFNALRISPRRHGRLLADLRLIESGYLKELSDQQETQ